MAEDHYTGGAPDPFRVRVTFNASGEYRRRRRLAVRDMLIAFAVLAGSLWAGWSIPAFTAGLVILSMAAAWVRLNYVIARIDADGPVPWWTIQFETIRAYLAHEESPHDEAARRHRMTAKA